MSRAAGKARVGRSLAQLLPPAPLPCPAPAWSQVPSRTERGPGMGWKGDESGACAAAARPVTGTPGVGVGRSRQRREGLGSEATVCLGHLDLPILF